MHITHLQSATQIVRMGNTRILTDPWLTEGEYYGSWYHYPPFDANALAGLEYDFIYVSHIHPDHLSEATFRQLPHRKPVLIHNYQSKFVRRKLESFGFEVIECDHGMPFSFADDATLTIYAADNCNPELCGRFLGCAAMETRFGSTQIDTLAVFRHGAMTVINTNDCPYELARDTLIAHGLDKGGVDLLLVGYAGAGPYPQCFDFDDPAQRDRAAMAKQKQFLDMAHAYIDLLKPAAYAPFAGTYVLGARLAELNAHRGVPTVAQALANLEAVVKPPAQGVHLGQMDCYDVATGTLVPANIPPPRSRAEFMADIAQRPLDHDADTWDDDTLPLLITRAHDRFAAKAREIGFVTETTLVVQSDRVAFRMGLDEQPPVAMAPDAGIEGPVLRITVDHNLLHRLLRGPRQAHWNNAEIGSHLRFRRTPDRFERGLHHCLCFLHQ